jgi:hypothetical protein
MKLSGSRNIFIFGCFFTLRNLCVYFGSWYLMALKILCFRRMWTYIFLAFAQETAHQAYLIFVAEIAAQKIKLLFLRRNASPQINFLRRNAAQKSKKRTENYPFLRKNAAQQINFFAQKCRAASQRIASNCVRCSSSTTSSANGLHA